MKRILLPILALAGAVLLASGFPIGLELWVLVALMCGKQLQPSLYTFPTNCSGRLIDVSPTTGCTLSKAVIKPWTTADLEAKSLTEVGYDMEFGRLQEARIAGYKENGLAELVNSRVTNVKNLVQSRPIQGNKSIVFPWIQKMQRRNINIQYWKINSGSANANAGVGDVHPGAWDLVVANQSGAFATALPNIKNYFLPGRVLFVDYASSDGVAHSCQYKILAATAIGSGSTCTVTVQPNVSAAGWAALSAAEKLVFQIGGSGGGNAEAGTGAYIGANSVSDWESYKEMDTAINNPSVLHFAIQTSRILWQYTDEWRRIMANALMGTFFTKYWQLSEAEQRRQHQALFEKANLHSAFFGQKESEMQDPLDETKWRQLPTAVDPANSNCILEYKTRAEGIKTQLVNCSRYLDKAGGNIDLSDLFARHYLLCRAKEADGGEVDTTDWMTDHERAGAFDELMIKFYQAFYKNTVTMYIQSGETINPEMNTIMGFKRYPVPVRFGGGFICVYHHKFFADRALAFGASTNVHRYFMSIDWSDYQYGILATNRRVTQTNDLDETYRYVINVNKLHTMHQSITWTSILEDPNRHLMYQNFAGFNDDITPSGT
jgi:hypothetical protein